MARKPRSQWSPEYRRRIERGEARGKSRQEARGKHAGEHRERRERERTKLGGLDAYQRGKVDQFADKIAKRTGREPDAIAVKLRAWAGRVGYQRFNAFKAEIRALEKAPRIRVRVRRRVGERIARIEIGGGSNNAGRMRELFDEYDLPDFDDDPDDNFMWFFYH